VFEDNTAEAQAGAVGLTIGGVSSSNDIELLDCRFLNNSCTLERCTGGAVGIDFFAHTSFNKILMNKIQFIGNSATNGMGGAISLSTTVNIVTKEGTSDILLLDGCTFIENQAFYDGTAVGVFSLTHTDQVGLPVSITNCQFQNNSATRGSADSTALTAYRVLLTFNGTSSFVGNWGGGISLLGSRMDVKGEVKLDSNIAVFGAGIAMTGRSLILLFEGAILTFTNNMAVDAGAGMYVEYTSSDFVLAVLNRGCFIQYFSSLIDEPPTEWKAAVRFENNRAGRAGAAIYANDMSRCTWLGTTKYNTSYFIFNTPHDYKSPFIMKNNRIGTISTQTQTGTNSDMDLATDASAFSATTRYGDSPVVGYGEKLSFYVNSTDQFHNFRESVWAFRTEYQEQMLGALSSNETPLEYVVPERGVLGGGDRVNITVCFSLLGDQPSETTVTLQVRGCHPGYQLEEDTQTCICDTSSNIVVQCDAANRYFYARDGYWVDIKPNYSLVSSTTVPGFLNCTRQGALPGCEIKYDNLEEQCAQGRRGTLCGDCKEGYGVTFDLRFCRRCGSGGIVLFVFICVVTVVIALVVLFCDLPLPDEMKGFVFFAQVIGLIYRNAPYRLGQSSSFEFFDILINTLGFSLPFKLCPGEHIPTFGIALLGFVPPLLATSVAVAYILFAKKSKYLSERQTFNGFHFLYVFVYKYFLDTSFIFISCTLLGNTYVSNSLKMISGDCVKDSGTLLTCYRITF
jgi:predicted outer membrane repeat protein